MSQHDSLQLIAVIESARRQADRLRALAADAHRHCAERDAERVAFLARRWRGLDGEAGQAPAAHSARALLRASARDG